MSILPNFANAQAKSIRGNNTVIVNSTIKVSMFVWIEWYTPGMHHLCVDMMVQLVA